MTTDQLTPRTTATPRTDAALYPMNQVDIVWPEFARTLERELAAAKAERDLAITRVACIFWSGAIDQHTCGDVQKWADHYIAELTRLRAEVDSLKAWKARAEKAEAALAFIAEHGGTKHETECGTISCDGSWCAEQARAAIDAAMKGTPTL